MEGRTDISGGHSPHIPANRDISVLSVSQEDYTCSLILHSYEGVKHNCDCLSGGPSQLPIKYCQMYERIASAGEAYIGKDLILEMPETLSWVV